MATKKTVEESSTFDVFISYASVDREPVEQLVRRLKQDGFRVWFDEDQMVGGQTTLGQLADGIANSSHMIACLSDAYIERDFTKFELDTNQFLDPANKRNRTIPVKIRPLTKLIPTQIQAFNYRDLTDPATYYSEYQKTIADIHRTKPSEIKPTEFDRDALERSCKAPFEDLDKPNVALFQTRIAVEVICKFLYRQELGELPPGSTLDSLAQRLLSTGKLPEHIKVVLSIAQTYGNFVVKDRMEDYVITRESIQPGLTALKVLADWTFATYFGQPEKTDPWESVLAKLPVHEDPNERAIPGSRYLLRVPRLSLNSLGPLYAGRDKVWSQPVAVNFVALSEKHEAVFFEEIARFIRLNDASLVRPLDAGRIVVNDKCLCLYVILEHVDGPSGQDLAERFGTLPALAACELCRGVAISLEGFHSASPSIVHGDIKPANVMVDRYGRVKVLCIGRNTDVTAEDASSGMAEGKIDSFLFASPEQLSRAKTLTPKTDLYALRAMLFYLLTGEYEARIRGSDLKVNLSPPALEALSKLAACQTAGDARNILDLACQRLAGTSVSIRALVDCYREGKGLPIVSPIEPPLLPPELQRPKPGKFSLVAEFPIQCQNAWPLAENRVLVWEVGGDTLAILHGSELLWRDSHPMRVRRVSRGPGDQLAVTGWEGQVRCFTRGVLSASVNLAGAIGDVQFCDDRWIVGTWKHSLVAITMIGDIKPLMDVEKGVFRIAVMDDHADWFAVIDLSGGIAFYSGGKRVANIAPFTHVSSAAFVGRRLMLLSGQSLIPVELDGRLGSTEYLPSIGNARLLPAPSPGHCLLLAENGNSWVIDEAGRHLPYFSFPPGHALLSSCRVPKRFTLVLPTGGCAYWCDGKQQQSWSNALAANLSSDGRYVIVALPGTVQLYEDPR